MPVSLNKEHATVLRAVKSGKNVFLTGAGGTGKSHTIRAITEWATTAGIRHSVTAMTGCAALLLNPAVAGSASISPSLRIAHAKTLHSWAGVGLAREAPHELATAVIKNKRAAARWLDTQLLIIDEISMMTPEFLEKLDLVARRVRRRPAVRFGGLQLVLSGDFCQLPPVQRGPSLSSAIPVIAVAAAAVGGAGSPSSSSSDDEAKSSTTPKFVFEMPLWNELVDECHELVQIQRQSDPVFQRLLNEARFGELREASINLLTQRMGLPWQENEIRPTLIFSRNAEVNSINEQNMALLDGERHVFTVQTTYKDGHRVMHPLGLDIVLTRFDADAPYDTDLTLCIGAQVMLLINKDQEAGLVNGSRGVVTAFSDGGLPIVQFKGGPILVDRTEWWLPDSDYAGIGRSQIPLRVAYAITIHKSQGATLDTALIDIGNRTFEYGQAYVALSRVRSLDGLYIWKLDPTKVRCHPAVKAFYARLAHPVHVPDFISDPTVGVADDGDPSVMEPWSLDGVSSAWRTVLDPYLASTAGISLRETLISRNQTTQTAPLSDDVFAALRFCPDPAKVSVVILGQDPYHTPGMAHGLAFSVRPAVTKLPPSLQNIYKELVTDLGLSSPPTSGCLTYWATQGVLLLNDVLTVAIGSPQSHAGLGWEHLTAQILSRVLDVAPHVVVIAWGRPAQKKLLIPAVASLLAMKGHTVLTAPHPSPLSAHTGFFGSCPFSKANTTLVAHKIEPIKWI